MAKFSYIARTRGGDRVEGAVEANDRGAALQLVERLGHVPITVSEADGSTASSKAASSDSSAVRSSDKMRTRDVLVFTTELSDLLASGMKLAHALNTLASRETGTAGDRIFASLRDEIVQGKDLSEALTLHPRTFTNLYVNMIKAGEASGAMSEVLKRLVTHYERLQEVKEKVVMALVYPGIVITLGAATLVFSMVYVVPKFKLIFAQMNETLPLPTRILISSSDWLARYGVFALIGIGIVATLLHRLGKTPRGSLAWHGLLLRMPLIRGIVASGIFANLARTLGTLLSNGVPVLKALSIVSQTVGNAVIGRELKNVRERVTDGTSISGPLAAGGVFPRIMTDMMAVGEQTGDMTGALEHVARRYENELDRNVKIFTTALEPILIVVVAVLVGFVAVSILMAVFNLTNGLDV